MDLVTIDAPDGPAEAYVARPDSGGGPGVLFFIDAIGLRPRIAEMADRIASWGYVVLAPNVLYRSGTAAETSPTTDLRQPGAREAFFAHTGPRIEAITAPRAEADIRVWTDTLAGLEGVDPDGPFGAVGFCMGARLAIRASGLDRRYAAVGGFHGGALATDAPDGPRRVRLRARRQRRLDAARAGRAARGRVVRRRAHREQRGLPGRGARVLDVGHVDVRRGRDRAHVHRARGALRPHPQGDLRHQPRGVGGASIVVGCVARSGSGWSSSW
jgi:carboxymethylenebutenolidase